MPSIKWDLSTAEQMSISVEIDMERLVISINDTVSDECLQLASEEAAWVRDRIDEGLRMMLGGEAA